MHDPRIPGSPCPNCLIVLDAATSAYGGEVTPKPGDVTLCSKCGTFLQFGEGLVLQSCDIETVDLDAKDKAHLKRVRAFFLNRKPS